jgi:hypothetical protein
VGNSFFSVILSGTKQSEESFQASLIARLLLRRSDSVKNDIQVLCDEAVILNSDDKSANEVHQHSEESL